MTNNKQQTAVEWLWEIAYNRELTVEDWKQAKERYNDEIEGAAIISSATESTSKPVLIPKVIKTGITER